MIRNVVLLLLAAILLAVVIAFDVNYLRYKAPVPYSKWTTITWQDFTAFNRPGFTLYGGHQFAFISSEIDVRDLGNGKYEIQTYFHPARSYVFNVRGADKALLKHELYHLHITEIMARKMRQEVMLTKSNQNFNLSEIEEVYKSKEDEKQKNYDRETNHGYVLNKQKIWESQIDSLLLSLKEYSNPTIP